MVSAGPQKPPTPLVEERGGRSMSLTLAEGGSLLTEIKVFGSSDLGVTADIYGHAQPEVQRGAIERVAALLHAQR